MTDVNCKSCGAVLDSDQRYCLNCGRRRGEPRIDFRRHVTEPPRPAQIPDPTPAAEQKPQRDYTPLAAAGGIAVLGLMLLVGVLIGRGDGGEPAAAPTQVLRVPAGGGEEATARDGSALGDATAGAKKASAKGKGKGGEAAVKAPPPEITADDSELEALQGQSGQEYSENSAKLPDEIATEGAPPPEDDKKPGGGSAGTTVE